MQRRTPNIEITVFICFEEVTCGDLKTPRSDRLLNSIEVFSVFGRQVLFQAIDDAAFLFVQAGALPSFRPFFEFRITPVEFLSLIHI